AQPAAACLEGPLPDEQGAERRRPVATSHHEELRGQPQAAAHRLPRYLLVPRMGRRDAGRGDADGDGRPPALGQDPLSRRLEFFRLARHEDARRLRARSAHPAGRPADPLHAAGARGGIRALADRRRPGRRRGRVVAPRGRALVGQVSPRQAGARRHAASLGWTEPPVRDVEHLYDIVEALVAIARTRDASPAQIALAWLMTRPAVASVVIGARTEAQLADNLKA